MTIAEYKEEILLKLGAPVVDVEIEEVIERIIASSFKELKRYISVSKLLTIPYSQVIDLAPYNVQTIHYILRDKDSGVNSNFNDAFYLATTLVSNTGYDISDYTRYLMIQQIKNTMRTDLDYIHADDKLYISCTTPYPKNITIAYTPKYSCVEEVTDPYWEDMLQRLSLANSKIILGRIRGKYSNSTALYNLDGDKLLEEGRQELTELRQFLSDNFDLQMPID
jgi:hypothetical protein